MRNTYVGVDWASEKHDVLIADEAGEEILFPRPGSASSSWASAERWS